MNKSFYEHWYPLSEEKAYEQRGFQNGRRFRWLIALDDWCPNYQTGWILAEVVPMFDGTFKLWVEGMDDTSMEKNHLTEEQANHMLDSLPALVDVQTFLDLGFIYG